EQEPEPSGFAILQRANIRCAIGMRTWNLGSVSDHEGRIHLKQAQQTFFGVHGLEEALNVLVVRGGTPAHVLGDCTHTRRASIQNRLQNGRRVLCGVLRIEQQLGKLQNLIRLEHGASLEAGFVSLKQLYPLSEALSIFVVCPNSCPYFSCTTRSTHLDPLPRISYTRLVQSVISDN